MTRFRNEALLVLQSTVSVLTDERSELADEELLRLISDGDREAFVTLYRRYQDMVYRFAYQLSGNQTVADDVTQETFMTLVQGARRYNASVAKFSTYLYGIVRHLARRHFRRERVFEMLTGGIADRWKTREPSVEQSLVDAASKRQTVDWVRRAVRTLPTRYREVVVLCDLQGTDYGEAAAIIGCAVGTVRSRLHRGRQLLRHKLEQTRGRATNGGIV